ncbi:hypothetical protein BXZ70DRAFT_684367 [Cristinia sonorae]|uniref:HMG box domain-containing protein n=1 Tax=Cristinia sonorae TaxID=1940300 RepID=A0A8K0UU14_9AGAR|nr:hypothetical protein BXZ70DRAFT_684367 [Cristinia sonorae]
MSFAHTCRRRTPNPFILFRTEFAKRRPVQVLNVSATEVSKEAGAAWKALSAEQRAPYEEQARVLVAKHAAMHQGDVSQCTWKPQNRPIRLKEAKVTKKKPTPRAVIRPDPTVDFAAMCASLESNPQYRAAMAAQAAVMRGETLDSASRPPEAATPLDDPLAQSNPLINDIILPTTTGVSCGVNVASTAIEPMPHIGEPFPVCSTYRFWLRTLNISSIGPTGCTITRSRGGLQP